MELSDGGDGFDWFFLDMAHCQLGLCYIPLFSRIERLIAQLILKMATPMRF